ncbi:ATP-binding protein [Cellulosimicrobium sp. Marseille-Q4280]|uniref:ATP-binding protein n=1 Tax=Cellulosimicrobium sp. Marseille-Q4280 TaxID=2937992 RepID=UPI00204044C4|nr:ATP-binding protein [Cellulosimicrobium sp. Marseille-Q4280]
MSTKTTKQPAWDPEMSSEPRWPTFVRGRWSGGWRDGIVLGAGRTSKERSLWMYRAVPLGPVADAKSIADMERACEPILTAYEELAALTSTAGSRRASNRQSYRETHLLAVNIPHVWTPPRDLPVSDYLARLFPPGRGAQETISRVVLFGVRLTDSLGGGRGFKGAVESVAETLWYGGVPEDDYEPDARKVATALERAGMTVPTAEQFHLAESWWNGGAHPDTYVVPQQDCLHIFSNSAQAAAAKRLIDEGASSWQETAPSMTVTMASVNDLDLPFTPGEESRSWWMTQLLDADCAVVSVRGRIEPAKITRGELRRNRQRNENDIQARAQAGKMDRSEQDDQLALLTQVEDFYAKSYAPPTLVDATVTIGINGYEDDLTGTFEALTAKVGAMPNRQRQAMAETMIGSPVRANASRQDLPTHVIAYSGAPGLSVVGDRVAKRALLLGFTERDKQPAWLDPLAASDQDSLPICVCAGATGSGKSQLMLWLAAQAPKAKIPAVLIDPKTGSDHSTVVERAGGQVYSLDKLVSADGVFDPLRFSRSPEQGVELAASMIMSVNPWGEHLANFEVPLLHALNVGVQMGATCTGQALQLAMQHGAATAELVTPIYKLGDAVPMFRAMFGVNPQGQALSMHDGLTLIKVGEANLNLPEPGQPNPPLPQRVALALVRMMVFGSAMALTGRNGMILLDEAWVFLGAGRAEIERLGRLARSQRVFPMLFTQRVTDATNAGLAGYISRGIILPIEDPDEARAALELFKVEATEERMARITSRATKGEAGGTAWNWNSMRALRDPESGVVDRGAVGLYCDLSGRAVPTEIVLPKAFLEMSSTTERDILARKATEAARAAKVAAAQPAMPSSAGLFGSEPPAGAPLQQPMRPAPGMFTAPVPAQPPAPAPVAAMPFTVPQQAAPPTPAAHATAAGAPAAVPFTAPPTGAVPFTSAPGQAPNPGPAAHGYGQQDPGTPGTQIQPKGKPLW